MIANLKEVYFDQFCKSCEYLDESEFDPNSHCYDCLDIPFNQYTHKPVNWKEAKEDSKNKKRRCARKNPSVK